MAEPRRSPEELLKSPELVTAEDLSSLAEHIKTLDPVECARRRDQLLARPGFDHKRYEAAKAAFSAGGVAKLEEWLAEHQSMAQNSKTNAAEETQALAVAELEGLIGLAGVKDEVRRLTNFLTVQKERQKHGLKAGNQLLHFVFTGNPGTGKTTVARILARIFFGFGLLKSAKLVECDRSKLVGGYLGQTAIKTNEVIDSALDGVVFIDEAYTLSSPAEKYGQGDRYGDEAIDTLLKRMEDDRGRLIVIAAGYPDKMRELVTANPGLESRFTRTIHFDDYRPQELCRIFDALCREHEYTLSPAACRKAFALFVAKYAERTERFGNGRDVRNTYERTVANQSDRLAAGDLAKDSLTRIEADDLPTTPLAGRILSALTESARFEGQCPGCKQAGKLDAAKLGQRVACKCGRRFVWPWWNLATGLPPTELTEPLPPSQPVDLVGIG